MAMARRSARSQAAAGNAPTSGLPGRRSNMGARARAAASGGSVVAEGSGATCVPAPCRAVRYPSATSWS